MPTMRKHNVLAILCSDIHLSQKAPVGRSIESNWFESMDRSLSQLRNVQREFDCPVVCAGDLFDRHSPKPSLINFALDNLPDLFYTIPGQHDLPNHRLEDIGKSAFWTLVKAEKVRVIPPKGLDIGNRVLAYGFAWGVEPQSLKDQWKGFRHLAVVHGYCWSGNRTRYSKEAPKEGNLKQWMKKLKGYDAVVFGDNHIPWVSGNVINCGTFMRRKTDDPLNTYVGFLLTDGTIERIVLDNSEDKWIDSGNLRDLEREWGMKDFIEGLAELGTSETDFADVVIRYCHNNRVSERTKKIIVEALER